MTYYYCPESCHTPGSMCGNSNCQLKSSPCLLVVSNIKNKWADWLFWHRQEDPPAALILYTVFLEAGLPKGLQRVLLCVDYARATGLQQSAYHQYARDRCGCGPNCRYECKSYYVQCQPRLILVRAAAVVASELLVPEMNGITLHQTLRYCHAC